MSAQPLPPCIECGHPLYRRGQPAEPGSRRGVGGFCTRCEKRRRTARTGEPAPTHTRLFTSPPPWMTQGLCRQIDPDLFYPEPWKQTHATIKTARWVCGRCPVRNECLEYALEHDERHGVWGGTTPNQRRQLIDARKAGAAAHGAA